MLFETVRVENGLPVLIDYHYRRLKRSSETLNVPFDLSFGEFKRVISEASPEGTNLVRFTLKENGEWEIQVRKCVKRSSVKLLPFTLIRRCYSFLSEHKISDTTGSKIALNTAQKKGFDEALLFDCKGFVSETCFANVFFYKDGILFTPSLKTGCLRGTRREFIKDLSREMEIPLVEGFFTLKELLEADEVFITSAREDACLVERIGKVELKKPRGIPISQRIKKVITELTLRSQV
jgi:branched-chain amino acid aminotransferase